MPGCVAAFSVRAWGCEIGAPPGAKGVHGSGSRLHMAALQAVEAKEGLEVKGNSDTVGSITFQMLFKYFPKLAGMSVRRSLQWRAFPPTLQCARGVMDTCGCVARYATRK